MKKYTTRNQKNFQEKNEVWSERKN
jgi:hypothetical protein